MDEAKKETDVAQWEWVSGTLKDPQGNVVLTTQSISVKDAHHILNRLNAYDALVAALKDTPCRRGCSANVVDMCDRCAALALATPKEKQ